MEDNKIRRFQVPIFFQKLVIPREVSLVITSPPHTTPQTVTNTAINPKTPYLPNDGVAIAVLRFCGAFFSVCSVTLLIIHISYHKWAYHVDSGITGTVKNDMLDKGCQHHDLNAIGGHESKASDFVTEMKPPRIGVNKQKIQIPGFVSVCTFLKISSGNKMKHQAHTFKTDCCNI
jgi:hypothetical protein